MLLLRRRAPLAPAALALLLLVTVGCLATVGCSSSGPRAGSTTETAGSVTLRDYSENSALKLISDGMLVEMGIEGATFEERRLNFDSNEQTGMIAKVCENDTIAGLAQAFEESGLAQAASDGPAPETGREKVNSIEIVLNGRTQHLMSDAAPDLIAFVDYMKGFIEVYNLYEAHASVEGAVEFKGPKRPRNYGGNR
ncbi:MAG: hypothetical protein AAGB93_01625 [Planctomycetota bacterium]